MALPREAPDRGDETPAAAPRRVLVVEDAPEVRRVVERLLARYGYAVDVAENGARAIDSFRRDPKRFDAVILDLELPGMGGWECLEALDRLRPVPALVSSGCEASDAGIPARRGGAALRFIAKPYSGRALRDALEQLFASS